MWKITFNSGAVRTMRAEDYVAVVDRLEWEAKLVNKKLKDLGIWSIVKMD